MKPIYQNFDKQYPIHMACGRYNNIRTSLQYISFQYGYAYATDSHILVRARLTDISTFDEQDLALLEGKFIHWSIYRKIIKSKGEVTITEDSIIVKEEQYSVSYPLLTSAKIRYPDCEKAMKGSGDVTIKQEFGINPDNLAVLGDVMNAYDGVFMKWETNRMFVVTPIGGHKDIKGVIMTRMI